MTLALSFTILSAAATERAVLMEGSNAPAVRDGASIYAFTCSVCHGEDGRGAMWGKSSLDPPPIDFSAAGLGAALTRERMIASVLAGRPGTAMTAFASQLTVQEVELVVDHIRSSYMQPNRGAPRMSTTVGQAVSGAALGDAAVASLAPAPDLPMPQELVGDAEAGARLYTENCVPCHGARGDGAGPRAYFIFPKPRDFTADSARARLSRPVLFNAIRFGVAGREMPAWSFVLNDQQIADLTEYVHGSLLRGTP